jgi:hypothetical protein
MIETILSIPLSSVILCTIVLAFGAALSALVVVSGRRQH